MRVRSLVPRVGNAIAYWDQESWNYFLKKLKYSYLANSILLSIIFSHCIHEKYIEMSGSYRQGDEKARISFDVLVNQQYYNIIDMQVSKENRTVVYFGISIAIYFCLLITCLATFYVIYRICKSVFKGRTSAEAALSLPP
jgi:hypothetical protein